MNDIELIRDVLLNYPQHYIMYRGGSGGEFLVDLISEYSHKFSKIKQDQKSVTSLNRTQLQLPEFYQIVSMVGTDTADINDLIFDIQKLHIIKNINIEESASNAIAFLTKSDRIPILRTHFSRSLYFNKHNTHMILIDTPDWYAYREILLFLKTNKTLECTSRKEIEDVFRYELETASNTDRLNDAIDWVVKNNISSISNIHAEVIAATTIPFADILCESPAQVFKKYNHIDNSFLDYYNFYEPKLRNQVNTIEYSKFFNKGYLEDMFDISSSEFHDKLIKWHENNLKLMEQHDFDITPYILL